MAEGFSMAKGALHRLTTRAIVAAEPPGLLGDGGNLYYKPAARGRGGWLFRFVSPFTGKRREAGLGSFPDVSLAEARAKAAEARKKIIDGIDPIDVRSTRQKRGEPTFGEAMVDLIEAKRSGWKNAKHADQWTATLKTYAAALMPIPITLIEPRDVANVLSPIWLTKEETARRVRGRIEAVCHYAEAHGFQTQSPAALARINKLLPRQRRAVSHYAATPLDKAPAAFRTILEAARVDPWGGAAALAVVILTASRAGEIRHMVAKDLHLKDRLILIPGARMKEELDHLKPLSGTALEILKANQQHPRRGTLVFPGRQWKPLSDMTLAAVMKRHAIAGTVHGWRAVFRTWAREIAKADRDTAELCLAHKVYSDTEAAYQRSALLEERRALLALWEQWLLSSGVSK